MAFEEFPKIARLSRECVVTEKIDGTNAQVHICTLAESVAMCITPGQEIAWSSRDSEQGLVMLAGSRTRYITLDQDNHGFARWVKEHADELWALGHGRHYGEWWGSGIQRGYGLVKGEKRFSLFNVGRWADSRDPLGRGLLPDDKQDVAPACCHVVPVIGRGNFDTFDYRAMLATLESCGSYAAPGFMKPEGIVIYHEAARQMFKKTIEKDDAPKSAARDSRAADAVATSVG